MKPSLCIRPQSLVPKDPISFHHRGMQSLSNCKNFPPTSLQWKNIHPHLILSNNNSKTPFHQFKKSVLILAARRNPKRRTTLRISTKAALECAFLIATTLKIVPEPVYMLIKEGFDGGSGGGGGDLGFWNGFRGGGWFDGWGGKRKKLRIWGLLGLTVVGVLFLVLMLGKDFEGFGEMGLGILGLVLLWMLERDWKRGAKGWTLGFCSCALMVFLGFKKKDMQKWIQRHKVHSPMMDLFKRKSRKRFL